MGGAMRDGMAESGQSHPVIVPPVAPELKTAVIVPAYNEAGRITNVLKAIAASSLVDEIIVVTDGCDDSTPDEARGFAARLARGEMLTVHTSHDRPRRYDPADDILSDNAADNTNNLKMRVL